jgi:hypothetical protein
MAEKAPTPTARSAGATGVIDGKIYVAGGRPSRGHDFAVYDPGADTWTVLPDVPTQRNHQAAGAIDGLLHVIGGRFGGGVGSEMTGIVEVYDLAGGNWRRAAVSTASSRRVASMLSAGKATMRTRAGSLPNWMSTTRAPIHGSVWNRSRRRCMA